MSPTPTATSTPTLSPTPSSTSNYYLLIPLILRTFQR
jgi:hypothetical protein